MFQQNSDHELLWRKAKIPEHSFKYIGATMSYW